MKTSESFANPAMRFLGDLMLYPVMPLILFRAV